MEGNNRLFNRMKIKLNKTNLWYNHHRNSQINKTDKKKQISDTILKNVYRVLLQKDNSTQKLV